MPAEVSNAASKEIGSVEDLKNLRIRTYDAMGTRVFKALGASPLQISWADVVPQLATGTIGAVLTGVDGGAAGRFWDYTDTFTQIHYAMPLSFVHINADVFDELPAGLQETVMQAGGEAAEWRAEQVKANLAAEYEELRANGMTVIEQIDPRLAAALDRAGQDIVDAWKAGTGARAEEILGEFRR